MMTTRNSIAGLLVLAVLTPNLALGAIERGTLYQQASQEFTCEAPEQVKASEDGTEEFDENALPLIPELEAGQAPAAEDPAAGQVMTDTEDGDRVDWRQAYERYRERTHEFAETVNRIVSDKYAEELAELRAGYERVVGRADVEEKLLRQQAIQAHEKFIKDHPGSEYTARRMFRLAELYFEESEEKFLADNERYDELSTLFDAGKIEILPPPPLKDYRKPIGLYKKIIKRFPDYGDLGAVYYMLGYTYSDESSKHLDPFRAEETYRELLANVPSSPYRAQAYFRLGDLYFEENETQLALNYYNEILSELEGIRDAEGLNPSDERLYELALYKLAWAEYKLDNLETAISRFSELLDWAEEKEAKTGVQADLKPESVRYLAISLVDLATERFEQPVDFARAQLTGAKDDPWYFPVLVEIAGILKDQARFEDAIVAYQRLQEERPNHPKGPDFQNNVIVLNQNLVPPDADAAAQARVALTERYGAGTPWFEANKNNKEAVALANSYILESLQWVAFTFHNRARESEDPQDYLIAARKYLEYLESYPFAKNAYELNYYLADCYFWIGKERFQDEYGTWTTGWEKAISQYARLFGFPEKAYEKEAVKGIMFAYNSLWKEFGGDITQTPEALENLKPPMGETVQFATVPLTELEQNYIRSVRWVERTSAMDPDLPTLLYDVAQIYYYKNHLGPARRLFDELIDGYPQTDFASFAGGLLVNSYRYTGDLTGMRAASERVASLDLGQDAELRETRNAGFVVLARASLFKEGEVYYNAERYDCALLSFLDYYDRYGAEGTDTDPKDIDFVIYNVAQSYSKLGKTTVSNEFYELLLRDFPHSAQAPRTFWRMASNYERVLELEKAVQYYTDLIRFHPGHEDTVAALYNAAFLQVGLGRFDAAARAYESYHDSYIAEADSKNMLFRAAEMYEADGNIKQARRVYQRWLDLYGGEDADRWVETQWKLASYFRDEGKSKKADALVQLIADSYFNVKEDLGGIGHNISASIRFKPVKARFDEYAAFRFPNTENQEELAAAVKRKQDWNLEIIAAMDQFVLEHADDFEWGTAALYYKALSIKNHAETWRGAANPFQPCFDRGDDPDCEERFYVYDDLLAQKSEPLFNTATDRFVELVNLANQKKRHTVWITRALEELSRIDPNTYPVPKPENVTLIESDTLELPARVEAVPEASLSLTPARTLAAMQEAR